MRISLIGAGGIGSNLGVHLAKMGATNLTVYDDDTVETHNISNQFYPISAIGKPKVEALKSMIEFMEGVSILAINSKFDPDLDSSEILIACVDSMSAREEIYKSVKSRYGMKWFIDCRMGANAGDISFVPNTEDGWARYEANFFSDDKAEPVPCTARSTIYAPSAISAFVCEFIGRMSMDDVESKFSQTLFNIKANWVGKRK